MQKWKQFIKRFLVWIGAALFLSGALACGQTKSDAYGMPTDVERLFTTASQLEAAAPAANDSALPDGNYTWSTASDDGHLLVTADAPVTAPGSTMTMTHVSGEGFTQAQVTGIFRYLFTGRTVTELAGQNSQTKAEIQAQLDRMNRDLEDGTYENYGFSREEYEEAIAQCEQAYRNAPQTAGGEETETDGTMRFVQDGEQDGYRELSVRTDSMDALVVRSYPSGSRAQLPSSCRYDRYDSPEYSMLDAVSLQPGDALPSGAQAKLTRTYDEAKAMGDELFASAGVDVSLLAAYVVGDRQTGSTDGIVREAEHYAYEFLYTRSVRGVPVATDVWSDDDGTSGFPFRYEQISVTVDDEGIARFLWNEPITLQDDATNCTSLLTFPQAQEIFEKMVPIVYGSLTTSVNPKLDYVKIGIGINRVQLCLLRVKEPTAEQKSGLLVPAWVFYGDVVEQAFWKDGSRDAPLYRQGMNGSSGCAYSLGPAIVFAVNALDGSVIDTSKGY
ncbi:MAG: DUF6034 family protein [Eubacteriales bacterium]|nr:DUF6034 family protein [Eubacteriales bacterium]